VEGRSGVSCTVQGGGQDRLGTSWGDGYVTDPKWIRERQLADANGFFEALLQQPYVHQVVLAPHLYGVSVSKSSDVGPKQWEKYRQLVEFCVAMSSSCGLLSTSLLCTCG